jgi:hypothetical protein
VTFSAVSDTRCSTYLIFIAFLTAESFGKIYFVDLHDSAVQQA